VARPREEDAVSVNGYAGPPQANSQDTSGQAREEDAVRVMCEWVRRYAMSRQPG